MEHVSIVSHDSGGAEILSSWLRRNNCAASVVAKGPAKKIFKRKCPNIEFVNLDQALIKSTWLLCGTGWQSNFERLAIAKARDLGIKTVAFLDHWVNYLERFKEHGHFILPDEIWVGDKDAKVIACGLFNKTPVILKPNPYFEDLIDQIKVLNKNKSSNFKNNILYVSEPVAEHALVKHGNDRHWGYTEFDALSFFLKNISVIDQNIECITIRPHPSEREDKYHWVSNLTTLPVNFGGKKTLLDEMHKSSIVVGCESMAMVVGLLAKKRVISVIPPGGRPCQLPHVDIENFQELVKKEKYKHE